MATCLPCRKYRPLLVLTILIAVLSIAVAACGGNGDQPAATPRPVSTPSPAAPAGGVGSAIQIASAGNDLKFEQAQLNAKGGAPIKVTLKNNAASAALQHNWVLVKQGTEDQVETAALQAGAASDWIPKNNPNVIAFVPLTDGGQTKEATFAAPPPGTYGFICSFPGHPATMRGTLTVTRP